MDIFLERLADFLATGSNRHKKETACREPAIPNKQVDYLDYVCEKTDVLRSDRRYLIIIGSMDEIHISLVLDE